jgi:hypothetical protein
MPGRNHPYSLTPLRSIKSEMVVFTSIVARMRQTVTFSGKSLLGNLEAASKAKGKKRLIGTRLKRAHPLCNRLRINSTCNHDGLSAQGTGFLSKKDSRPERVSSVMCGAAVYSVMLIAIA